MCFATGSCSGEGYGQQIGTGLSVLETVCEDTKGKRLGLRPRFVGRGAIGQNPWKIRYLGNPATVRFLLQVDLERHSHLVLRSSITPWGADV